MISRTSPASCCGLNSHGQGEVPVFEFEVTRSHRPQEPCFPALSAEDSFLHIDRVLFRCRPGAQCQGPVVRSRGSCIQGSGLSTGSLLPRACLSLSLSRV